jgi:hypothetical protein
MAGTAKRRADRARIRHNRLFYWDRRLGQGQGSVIDAPTPCSCWMCGNPRRHFGERTAQEQRWIQEVENEDGNDV